jgi:hypothetical protein
MLPNRLFLSFIFLFFGQMLILTAMIPQVGWGYKIPFWVIGLLATSVFSVVYHEEKNISKAKPKPVILKEPLQYEKPKDLEISGRGTRLETSCIIGRGPKFWPQVGCHLDTVDPREIQNTINWLVKAKSWLILKREDRIREDRFAIIEKSEMEHSV